MQAKYDHLTPESRQAGPLQPPTLEDVNARVSAAKKLTVRDVWGLMLTTVPGVSLPPVNLDLLLAKHRLSGIHGCHAML